MRTSSALSRSAVWGAGFLALLLPLALPAFGQTPEYERRLRRLEAGDDQAEFKLALWCMGQGEALKQKGRDHFENVARRAEPRLAGKAFYRLGLYYLTQGRTYHDLKWAGRYLSLATDGGNDAARRRLLELEETHLENKRTIVERATRQLSQRKFAHAVRTLKEAYRLPLGEGSISDAALLERLAFAYAEIGKELRRLDRAEVNPACPDCSGTGFSPCEKCDGSGKAEGKTAPSLVTGINGSTYKKGEKVTIKCPHCKGTGGKLCSRCSAMGLNMDILPETFSKGLRSMGAALKRLSRRKKPWDAVRKTWEKVVEYRLHFPAGFKVEGIRGAEKFVPPDDSLVDRPTLEAFWKAASDITKHKFLLGFAADSSRYLRAIFLHDRGSKTLKTRAPYDHRAFTIPVEQTVVSALPEVFHDRWVSVIGRLGRRKRSKDAAVEWKDKAVLWVPLKGRTRTPLISFFWSEEGREKHTLLAKLGLGRAFSHLERFVWSYKYPDVEEAIDDIRKDSEVVLYGRMVFNPEGIEPGLLEVWHVDLVREFRSRYEIFHPSPPPRMPTSLDGIDSHVLAGYHVNTGLSSLRDEVFTTKRKKLKGEAREEHVQLRRTRKAEALKSFRTARSLLENAIVEQAKADAYLVELLAQVQRFIEAVLRDPN